MPKLSIDSCRVTHDKKHITVECDEKKNTHEYNKFEMHKIIKNDAPIRHRAH